MIHTPSLPPRHRFSVDEYERMIDYGILTEDDRVELLDGEIVKKMAISDRHVSCVNRINRVLSRHFADVAVVSIHNAIRLAQSEPEPDAALLKFRADEYAMAKARPADDILIIEAAESSLEVDRNTKGPLYASAGIPEYWIVNLNDDCLEVHRSPQPDGKWADRRVVQRGEQIESNALPGTPISVSDLLPPPA